MEAFEEAEDLRMENQPTTLTEVATMTRKTITGDARKLLDTFIQYTTGNQLEDVADAMYYQPEEMLRRALELREQLNELDAEAEVLG
jgi:hypothetical protein